MRGLYLLFLDRELDLAVLTSTWLSADHAARMAAVTHDKPWRDRRQGWNCPDYYVI